MNKQMRSLALLERLIAFDTTSYKSNLELIDYVKQILEANQINVQLNFNQDRTKANLFASTGPETEAGILRHQCNVGCFTVSAEKTVTVMYFL